jgi:hypothetical protein
MRIVPEGFPRSLNDAELESLLGRLVADTQEKAQRQPPLVELNLAVIGAVLLEQTRRELQASRRELEASTAIARLALGVAIFSVVVAVIVALSG